MAKKNVLNKKIDVFNKIDEYSLRGLNTDNSALNQIVSFIINPWAKILGGNKLTGRTLKGKMIWLGLQLLMVLIGVIFFVIFVYFVILISRVLK